MMPRSWDMERLNTKTPQEVLALYRNAASRNDEESKRVAKLILESGLLVEESGGLPFDHPTMLEIEAICALPDAIAEALEMAEKGMPPLAGMEHRLVSALRAEYGPYYTTHHAGRCIGAAMLDRGWTQAGMKPMPKGSVAKTATWYSKKGSR